MPFQNPIIPGFHPDPSICRVGQDYYLVTSTFEYFPAVPVFHSRDLVNWQPIGHCITRDSQLDLSRTASSCGIFAPSLRYHDGTFYMITTDFTGAGHFYVTTDDPAGEWSDPIYVEGPGFDPDLFFDDDGHTYFIREDIGGYGIRLWEIDLPTGKLIGDEHIIWDGHEDPLCEAPHLYKKDGWYYLLVAEGGTHRGHCIMIGRSKTVTGPYAPCPANPILTHRNQALSTLQATGHGDLVQTHTGDWWVVFLAIRQEHTIASSHHLGRETFLAPVTWNEEGWPVINHNKPITYDMPYEPLPPVPTPPTPVRDDFSAPKLNLCWNFRRNPLPGSWSTGKEGLILHGRSSSFRDAAPSAFIGRRQQHFNCRAETELEFNPSTGHEEAGLVVIMNETHNDSLAISQRDGCRIIFLRRQIGDLSAMVFIGVAPQDGPVRLKVVANPTRYDFYWSAEEHPEKHCGSGATHYLSTEVAGGFTGVYLGMYATGNGNPCEQPATFHWFDYEPLPLKPDN